MKELSQDGRRTRHEPRKQDLLAATVMYVFEHGISDLSIRPLAAALGISHRTLLYHFHAKEALVVEVLKEVKLTRFWEWRNGLCSLSGRFSYSRNFSRSSQSHEHCYMDICKIAALYHEKSYP